MRRFILLIIIFLIPFSTFFGVETNIISYEYSKYKLQIIDRNYVTRDIDNKIYNYGILGIDRDLYNILTNSPRAKIALDEYNNDMLLGKILFWSGAAIILLDIALFYINPRGTYEDLGSIFFVVPLMGGVLLGAIGTVNLYFGLTKFDEVIYQYNEDLKSSSRKVSQNNYNIVGISLKINI